MRAVAALHRYYEHQGDRLVSRYFPRTNILPHSQADAQAADDFQPPGYDFFLYYRSRPIRLIVGGPEDLALAKEPSSGRLRHGQDTGYVYHGLADMLFMPEQRLYIIDEHHFLYYVVCEALQLGLIRQHEWLYHFDLHHDFSALHTRPPSDRTDLSAQARYTIEHLRVGNHLTALAAAALIAGITWVTLEQDLAYKCSDLVESPVPFEILPWQHLHRIRPNSVVTLDWDLLSGLFGDGQILQPVTPEQVLSFARWWKDHDLHRTASLTCIATSPGYTDETTLLAGLRAFISAVW